MKQITDQKMGVLLTNLGTPSAPTPKALRRYLAEFLGDPRVVELPRLLWWLILHGIILRFRPRKSARLYQKIWTPEGSPLLVNSLQLLKNLQNQFNPSEVEIFLGMNYGQPSIPAALAQLQKQKIQRLLVLPLYPQYSATTTAATFDSVAKTLQTWRHLPEINMLTHYYTEPEYIAAIAASILQQQVNPNSHLLFSFHGLPQRFVDAGDPYQQQCLTTAQLVTEQLQLRNEAWSIAFQSRFGAAKWLQPYCDKILRELPAQGKKDVTVICPGFSVDCLETLEEIAIQNRKLFMQAGGEKFSYISALNASNLQVEMLKKIIVKNIRSAGDSVKP